MDGENIVAHTVLIVEDHPLTVSGLLHAFAAHPSFKVISTAGDATTGLRLAKDLSPTITLLDLHLPDRKGPASTIQDFCQLKNTKVVVLSAEVRTAFVQAVLKSGAVGYLTKSEPPQEIIRRMLLVVEGRIPQVSRDVIGGHVPFTKAQLNILSCLAKGWKYQQIAESRNTSVQTVRHQCELLQMKAGVENREELIVWALENGYGQADRG